MIGSLPGGWNLEKLAMRLLTMVTILLMGSRPTCLTVVRRACL